MIKYKPEKFKFLFGGIFAAVGFACLAVIIFLNISWANFKETAVEADAVITDIKVTHSTTRSHGKTRHQTSHTVYIEYEVDGRLIETTLSYYNPGMETGDHVTVLYDPENPNHTMSNPLIASLIISIFVFVHGGIGVGCIISELKQIVYINGLIDRNEYVTCYEWKETYSGTRVNNVRYMQIECTYEGIGGTLTFRSHPYAPDRCPYAQGEAITVYVDVNNPKKYYVYEP